MSEFYSIRQTSFAIEVEELHVWGLSTSRIALTAHLVIDEDRLQREGLNRDQLLALARQRLEAFDIRKSTLQLETAHSCHLRVS
jgi:cobalt-zinc-cadmium efflux system protein